MKFIWRQNLGPDHCPYVTRWVLDFCLFSIRLHYWQKSDDLRHPHDHAWDFISVVLWGSIADRTIVDSERNDEHRPWLSCRFFRAEHQHSVVVDKPCWTLLVTGPERRKWGYWVKGRFRKRNKYYFEHGHHEPCS